MYNEYLKEIKYAVRILFILLVLLFISILTSCKTKYITIEKEVPIDRVKVEYKTNTKVDSVYIHDSINIHSKGDTVFKDKVRLIYKNRLRLDTIHRVDSIEKPVYITKTIKENKENNLNKMQLFFLYSGIILWLCVIFYILIKALKK